jgi:hypothetical protein
LYFDNFDVPHYKYLTLEKNYGFANEHIIDDNDINIINVLAHNIDFIGHLENYNRFCIAGSIIQYYCCNNYVFKLLNFEKCFRIVSSNDSYYLNMALKHKSFKIVAYILAYSRTSVDYVCTIKWNEIDSDSKFNDIIETLEYLVKNNALSIPHLFGVVSKLNNFVYKDKMLKFVKKYMSKEMIDILFI